MKIGRFFGGHSASRDERAEARAVVVSTETLVALAHDHTADVIDDATYRELRAKLA